jgi:periplasmic divalent cation tolerance protein
MPLILITTTLPGRDAAEALATALVEERLAACVQVFGPVESTYRWEGAVERAKEWSLHAKTTLDRRDALMARIDDLHPYEVPEIVAVRADAVSPEYLAWASAQVAPEA